MGGAEPAGSTTLAAPPLRADLGAGEPRQSSSAPLAERDCKERLPGPTTLRLCDCRPELRPPRVAARWRSAFSVRILPCCSVPLPIKGLAVVKSPR